MQEIEAKVLEIDREKVEAKLMELDAKCVFDDELWAVFMDDENATIQGKMDLLRLRKEGARSVMTYKYFVPSDDPRIKVMEEHETGIEDFEATLRILECLGYKPKQNLRKVRKKFKLKGVEIVIDEYLDELAYIPVFLEIEAPDIGQLHATAEALGISPDQLLPWTTVDLMEHYGPKE